ncbi:single-stranded DNA-binding protein [Bacillus chungangensis]|uniref:Frataxin-like iron-binding protein CyaY n=1 Tax=Bacillus chungangensis TaxID=587633 RepID=A0ABT9WMQ7_9BACI|nr:single-stranded DNA-binding protein [Bacillus chungangensis]MDQ0174438.1 frataxin-like iron-binding protein CyaY [Bacillus chungangensis]
MSNIRDILKQREEARDKAAQGGDSEFPDGVTRYVRMGRHGEVNAEGRTFIMLAKPDDWFFYFVHEDKEYNGKGYDYKLRKHTCLHSPKDINADLMTYFKPGKDECLTCKAGGKRKMFAIIPVYDLEYKTYRVIDTAEFHVNNLIADYDKLEKAAKKFSKDYTLVGDAVHISQVDKTYSLESGDAPDEAIEAAKAYIGFDFKYEELANFREEKDLVELLKEASDEAIDKKVLDEQFEF